MLTFTIYLSHLQYKGKNITICKKKYNIYKNIHLNATFTQNLQYKGENTTICFKKI